MHGLVSRKPYVASPKLHLPDYKFVDFPYTDIQSSHEDPDYHEDVLHKLRPFHVTTFLETAVYAKDNNILYFVAAESRPINLFYFASKFKLKPHFQTVSHRGKSWAY